MKKKSVKNEAFLWSAPNLKPSKVKLSLGGFEEIKPVGKRECPTKFIPVDNPGLLGKGCSQDEAIKDLFKKMAAHCDKKIGKCFGACPVETCCKRVLLMLALTGCVKKEPTSRCPMGEYECFYRGRIYSCGCRCKRCIK